MEGRPRPPIGVVVFCHADEGHASSADPLLVCLGAVLGFFFFGRMDGVFDPGQIGGE